MRISKKNRLKNCLDSLKEINCQLLQLSPAQRQGLLPLCQQMAVEMGNLIERWEADNTVMIPLLEEYCEELYQLYIAEDGMLLAAAHRRLDALLSRLEEGLDNIEAKPLEVVFLPYKASMWDAMESVYLTALQDKDCHAVVVPVPYYNTNPGKQHLSVEYEGDLFPEYISITDYRKYDLEERQPDAIFIHNPYDEYNYVTRVAEDYYSSRLAGLTEHLIYLPYFISQGNSVADHYCILPGTKYAWRTILQSERIRQCYVKCGVQAERVVALGSPKFDKVKLLVDERANRLMEGNSDKDWSKVPEEWRDKLWGKSVFLLNTHINYITNAAEELREGLQRIFSLFKKRKAAALIWRPHPLSIEAAKSLNPKFLESYLKLIEEFKASDIGIYDTTADMYKAIDISDAYIGGGSSLVTLYGVTGKPMYILGRPVAANSSITEEEKMNGDTQEYRNKIDDCVKAETGLQYLYQERFMSLECFMEWVAAGRDAFAEERKTKYRDLQYKFDDKETAGERIWNYVRIHIMDEEEN